MDSKIFTEVAPNELEQTLTANCLKTEEKTIQRFFTPEEMNSYRSDYFRNTLLIRTEIAKLNEAKKQYAEATKDAVKQNERLINNIQTGCADVDAQVYLFPDFESRMIGYYDNSGNLIESRRMRPEEQQLYIKQDN